MMDVLPVVIADLDVDLEQVPTCDWGETDETIKCPAPATHRVSVCDARVPAGEDQHMRAHLTCWDHALRVTRLFRTQEWVCAAHNCAVRVVSVTPL